MRSKDSEEGLENPCRGVIVTPLLIACAGLFGQRGDQKEVDDPANEKQAEGEEPDNPGYLFAKIKPVGSEETKNPEDVSDGCGVCACLSVAHDGIVALNPFEVDMEIFWSSSWFSH